MSDRDEILSKVTQVLVDALACEEEDVTPSATLIGDLGAESIDFLDIVFQLDKTFGIKIPRGELFPENFASAESGFVKEGKVTPDGVEELKRRMPHANVAAFAADPRVEKIQDLFTVEMIVNYVEKKLQG